MKNSGFWIKLCVFNFFIVSVIGVMMRYGMAFSLPGISHTFMQESHSHFAFYGWVSAAIYIFVARYLSEHINKVKIIKYEILMTLNQLGSYGMLFSFLYGGYFWLSIIFSSVVLFAGFTYFIFLMMDTKKNRNPEVIWLKAGAFFAVFSSIGIFGLAYFSGKKDEYDVLFRASTYFYLHYQYNGFFMFSCIGLFLTVLKKYKICIPGKLNRNIFYLMFTSCLFGYGLSLLWIEMEDIWRIFFSFISILQVLGIMKLLVWSKKTDVFKSQDFIKKILLSVSGLAFFLKCILQTLSTVPALGTIVFGNIHIVIAYLHLVLLMGVSLFLIWIIVELYTVKISKMLQKSIMLMISGIVFNEIILVSVGTLSAFYIPFPYATATLVFVSVLIMLSIATFLKEIIPAS
ncbi:hypothetical protein [Chryseobacterium cheonjiense]|uniref:Uncharacterized protein n=1 Tax=Chryseobacterium cheonjiense TaxID=2728845 RepID=A0A7Y0A4R9_9FLAO|nr:hypothetical protein [Chryseobacterium cheonjiense]NML56670.1 hypothetical protein [Chryseobacterium cheonjiense]